MSQSTESKKCECAECEGAGEAASPFLSVRYHFGMLLGTDDFNVQKNYHRGKTWLHSMWLHGEGVVWGLGVETDRNAGEIRVRRGLALDAIGRELHLDGDACLNVTAWFDDRRQKFPDEKSWFEETENGIVFDARVVICFKTCLTRQVPALAEPCVGAQTSTEYSRVFETVELLLLPGLAPDPAPPAPPIRYRRLRVLFGIEPADAEKDKEVMETAKAIKELPCAEQAAALLKAFRRFAAFDEIDLQPPEGDRFCIPLATIARLHLQRTGEKLEWVNTGELDVTVRPSHVATNVVQELLCRACCCTEDEPPALYTPDSPDVPSPEQPDAPAPPAPAGSQPKAGPEVKSGSVIIDQAKKTVRFQATADLDPKSLQPSQFSLGFYNPAKGWETATIKSARLSDDKRTVNIQYLFGGRAKPDQARFIAHGSGVTPLLGANLAEFNHGRDFVHMQKGRSR